MTEVVACEALERVGLETDGVLGVGVAEVRLGAIVGDM